MEERLPERRIGRCGVEGGWKEGSERSECDTGLDTMNRRHFDVQRVLADMTDSIPPITFDEFLKVELRVGRIVGASVFKEARKPSYLLHVDFGNDLGVKKSSAQIAALYRPDELVGKLVVAVVNVPSRQIGPLMSECLVTGFHNQDGDVALCVPDQSVPLGTRLL